MIGINREINDTLILRTKREEEKKRKPVYYLITRNRYDKVHSIFDEFFIVFFSFF